MHYLRNELYEQIKKSSVLFDFIQDAALDGLWYWDLENPEHEWMNAKFWTTLGYDHKGKPHLASAWQDIIHPEDKLLALENAKKHFADSNYPYDQEVRYRHKDGHTVWIRCKGLAIRDEKGKPIRMLGAHIDISQAKQQELKVREELDSLKAIFDNQSVYVVKIDLDGNFVFVNDFYSQSFGLNSLDFIGTSAAANIVAEDIPKLHKVVEECKQNPYKKVKVELSKSIEGKLLTALWEFKAVTNINGDVTEYLGIGYDITERVEIEQELKSNTLLLNDAQRIAKLGAWRLDVETNQTYWTEEVYRIHEVDESFDHNKTKAIEFYHPDYQKTITQAIQSTLENQVPFDEVCKFITGKNNERWVRASGYPVVRFGKVTHLIGMFQDITDAQEATNKIKESNQLLDALRIIQGLFIQNKSSNEVFALALDKLLELTVSKYGFIGKVFHTRGNKPYLKTSAITNIVWDEETQTPHREREQNEMKFYNLDTLFGELITEQRLLIINDASNHPTKTRGLLNGHPTINTFMGIPILLNHNLLGIVGIANREDGYDTKLLDKINPFLFLIEQLFIAQERELEEERLMQELIHSKNEAVQASLAKSEFLANMSHEIRTPLNSIIGFSDLLTQTPMNEVQNQYMKAIKQSGVGLLGLINDILDFSKIEAGKMEINSEKVNIYELCEQVIGVANLKSKQSKVELILKVSPQMPLFLWLDPLRIRQVLINLLSNAIKFTEKGEVELSITKNPNKLSSFRFTIRDTGIGISQEQQEKIFSAFSQADSSTTRKYGGTGLGISISNKLLLLMGSSLQLESELGKGSTFYFDLELRSEDADDMTWENPLKLRHLLIVDDNANNASILQEMLASQSITSDITQNGIVALEALSQSSEKYDALILDYNMPFMNGSEVIRQVREQLKIIDLPILLLYSSADNTDLVTFCDTYQVSRCLSKPIHYYQLFEALATLKGGLRSIQEKISLVNDKQIVTASDKTTILIADDNPLNRLLTSDMSKIILPNVEVMEVQNGLEAVQAFQNTQLDLILMDIQMPLMSGYEATQKIRALEIEKRTPILALTAGTVKGEKERCLAAGMDDYLSKPIDTKRLREAFEKWLPKFEEKQPIELSTKLGDKDMLQHFNKVKFLEEIGGDKEIMKNALELIRGGLLSDYQNDLEKALLDCNEKRIRRIAHAMKGTAFGMQFEILAKFTNQLEEVEPFEINKVKDLIAQISKSIDQVMIAID